MKFTAAVAAIAAFTVEAVQAGDINDIKHIVFFMQENRPFDHYFGSLAGVRGYNDRVTVPLSNGLDAFHQPINASDPTQFMLPFRVDKDRSNSMCMPAPDMGYHPDLEMFNEGRVDAWNTARSPGYGMSFFDREGLPYYYHLADNFAIGDQYFQSVFSSTNPNRMHFFSGSSGLSVGELATVTNTGDGKSDPGFDWLTAGELLENAGVSWKLYQQADNFNDNAFAWFRNFKTAKRGTPLHDKGMARVLDVIHSFKEDVKNDALPSVSWIVAPTRKSEHATNHPCAGEDWTARLLEALQANPAVYAKTAFILNYDEGGQFFDHAVPPTPPRSEADGLSTVTTVGEINSEVETTTPQPVGLGFRVPIMVVSPWTRGKIVNSETFDHVSAIKLLEKRFNVSSPTLSPWRRAMVGDLTSFFNFSNPDYSWPSDLPDTSKYVIEGDIHCHTLPDPVIPAVQSMPRQEEGVRVSRALPYSFLVSDGGVDVSSNTLSITIANNGEAGAPFNLYDVLDLPTVTPRKYAVESGKRITDNLKMVGRADSRYSYVLHGPNGFVREFSGTTDASSQCSSVADVSMVYSPEEGRVVLVFEPGSATADTYFGVVDNAYGALGDAALTVFVDGTSGRRVVQDVDVSSAGHWYDITVAAIPALLDGTPALKGQELKDFLTKRGEGVRANSSGSDSCYVRRFMGRMETGKDSISDPAMSAALPGMWRQAEEIPLLPDSVRFYKRLTSALPKRGQEADVFSNKDALLYDREENEL